MIQILMKLKKKLLALNNYKTLREYDEVYIFSSDCPEISFIL